MLANKGFKENKIKNLLYESVVDLEFGELGYDRARHPRVGEADLVGEAERRLKGPLHNPGSKLLVVDRIAGAKSF